MAHLVVEGRAGDPAAAADAGQPLVGAAMTVLLRLDQGLLERVHEDLSRPHPHAGARGAFVSCRPAPLRGGAVMLLGQDLHPVLDEDYERNDMVAAMLGAGAFRRILQYAY